MNKENDITPKSIYTPINEEMDVLDEFFEEFGVENKISKIKGSWE